MCTTESRLLPASTDDGTGLCSVWKVANKCQSIRRASRPRPKILSKVNRMFMYRKLDYSNQAINGLGMER